MNNINKILSIIIPTYNMEQYLRYCLDSLLIQKYFEKLEILVINDGSMDSSSFIAHEYESKYPGVYKVIDKENGNYGSCINVGLKEATGKYIKILDADDSFDTNNFEEFVGWLIELDADLILSSYAVVNEDRKIQRIHKYPFLSKRKMQMKDICILDSFVNNMQMHAVTYRKQLLLNINYVQTEGISYTDQQWIFIPMIKVNTVYNFNKYIYKYLIGRQGQTMDPVVLRKYSLHFQKCIWKMVDEYEKYKNNICAHSLCYLRKRLLMQIKGFYLDTFTNYSKTRSFELMEFDKNLKERSIEVYDYVAKPIKVFCFKFSYIRIWRKCKGLSPWVIRKASKFLIK